MHIIRRTGILIYHSVMTVRDVVSLVSGQDWSETYKPKLDSSGYLLVRCPGHYPKTYGNIVRVHRLTYEEHYKCCLLPWTDIHHINGVRTDNRIRNLKPLIHGRHTIISCTKKELFRRKCDLCGSRKTGTDPRKYGRPRPHWRRNPEDKSQWLCHACYEQLRPGRKNKK